MHAHQHTHIQMHCYISYPCKTPCCDGCGAPGACVRSKHVNAHLTLCFTRSARSTRQATTYNAPHSKHNSPSLGWDHHAINAYSINMHDRYYRPTHAKPRMHRPCNTVPCTPNLTRTLPSLHGVHVEKQTNRASRNYTK